MTSMISARKLTRKFNDFTAVDAIDLDVPEGALYGFLGLNGAGKSTTIRMLCGLLPPTSGEAEVAGFDVVRDTLEVRRRVGLIADLDAAQAHPSWTGREYVEYFVRLWNAGAPRETAEALLAQVGLDPAWWNRPVATYSTGMRRRLEIARALLGRPRVLFLDEPTRGLDLPAKLDMWQWLKDFVREERVTIFLSSHEVSEIRTLCEDVAVIAGGRLVYEGRASGLGRDEAAFESSLVKLLRSPGTDPKASWASPR